MARLFDDALSQYLKGTNGSPPITESPFTINLWIYTDTPTSGQAPIWIGVDATNVNYFRMHITSSAIYQFTARAGTSQHAISSGTVSTNTWTMLTAVAVASNNRWAYRDGANGGQNTDAQSPSGIDNWAIGSIQGSSPSTYMSGRIAEVAIWDVALSSTDVATLYNNGVGLPAGHIRPNSLLSYHRLLENDGDINWVGGTSLDLTPNASPTYAAHLPVMDVVPRALWIPSAAAPPAGIAPAHQIMSVM